MRMIEKSSVALFVFLLVMFISSDISLAKVVEIGTEVNIDENSPLTLIINLKNLSEEDILIREHHLPWNSYFTFHLIGIVYNNRFAQLEKALMISDPAMNEIILKPGQMISGRIHLDLIFSNINSILEKHDVGIFWTYSPSILNSVECKRQGGFILIRRK